MALSCAFITYVGPYNAEFRKHLQEKLFAADCMAKGVPCTEDLGISLFLVDAATTGGWSPGRLPSRAAMQWISCRSWKVTRRTKRGMPVWWWP